MATNPKRISECGKIKVKYCLKGLLNNATHKTRPTKIPDKAPINT